MKSDNKFCYNCNAHKTYLRARGARTWTEIRQDVRLSCPMRRAPKETQQNDLTSTRWWDDISHSIACRTIHWCTNRKTVGDLQRLIYSKLFVTFSLSGSHYRTGHFQGLPGFCPLPFLPTFCPSFRAAIRRRRRLSTFWSSWETESGGSGSHVVTCQLVPNELLQLSRQTDQNFSQLVRLSEPAWQLWWSKNHDFS